MSEITEIEEYFGGADTIPALLELAVHRFSSETAARSGIKGNIDNHTFIQLQRDSNALGIKLEKMGIECEKVAIIGDICYEWLVVYFGVIGSGNIVVPIDKDLSKEDVEKLLHQAHVTVIFFDNSWRIDLAQYISEHCKIIKTIACFQPAENFIGLLDFIGNQCNIAAVNKKVGADQTAMIVFTSGTTGESKGVMLSNRNICHNVLCSGYLIGKDTFKPGECIVPILPPHHMLQITAGILVPLLFWGMTICIGNGLKNISETLKRYRPALMIAVPMVVEGFYKLIWRQVQKDKKDDRLKLAIKLSNLLLKLRIDIRSIMFREVVSSLGGELRVLVCGGSYLDTDLVKKFQEFNITLLNGYGITECSPVVACNRISCIKRDSVGLVAPGPYCQVRIEKDEVLIRGSIVMQGYYMDEAGTNDAYNGAWFKTGDLGYLDNDNYLYITGRRKNLIILKDGNNISPEGIEKSIEKHPLVDSVFVYAVNKNKTDILVAAIHPNYMYARDNGIYDIEAALKKVVAEINKNWPLYKHIQMVEVHHEAFDKTALGKVKRFKYIT